MKKMKKKIYNNDIWHYYSFAAASSSSPPPPSHFPVSVLYIFVYSNFNFIHEMYTAHFE